ncbi:tRNA-uridine aminocarboxypropyltransferase [Parendozoicomonas haliclonae]|uniref:tRNA-uridine aminocarboxypropyltransferase n=1 Tax=Parendozoicomonas haliclonae TaxID=1960125 RepID=UPI0013FE3889|nr:tRNA-uridine aminocarboxypropyltransferase [Parendozoicomonas haliclonae]
MTVASSKRALCSRCHRPVSACYCSGLDTCAAPFRIVILRPGKEKKHALNTGGIVDLAVSNCEILEGEDFSSNEALLKLLELYQGRCWLLYPGEQVDEPDVLSVRRAEQSPDSNEQLLIVLDATWKKSRKMLYLFPRLAELPRISLSEPMASRYRLRKVPGQGFLSTVEAVVAVLEQAGHSQNACRQMLQAFESMIEHQIASMGAEVWQKNYQDRLPQEQEG